MNLLGACEWLADTWVSTGIRESIYLYPMLHWAHILSNSLMFGTIVFLDLRLTGAGFTQRRVSDMAGQLLPWTWAGWGLMLASGSLILISDPVKYYHGLFFRLKLTLMLVAGLNALLFHFTAYRGVAGWDLDVVTPPRARLAGFVSLFSWVGIVILGRAVGYFD